MLAKIEASDQGLLQLYMVRLGQMLSLSQVSSVGRLHIFTLATVSNLDQTLPGVSLVMAYLGTSIIITACNFRQHLRNCFMSFNGLLDMLA